MGVRLRMRGVIEYLVVIFMILDFNTIYSTALNIDYRLTPITAILTFALLLFNVYSYRIKTRTLNSWLLYFIPIYLLEIILFVRSVGSEQAYSFIAKFFIVFPLLVFLFMLYVERGEMYRLLEKYVNVVTIMAVLSLFFWLFGSQLNIIRPTNYIYASWGGNYNYPMWFGVYTQRQSGTFLGFTLVRNQSIFCEGPMYNFILIVALAYELFLRNHVGDKSGVSRRNMLGNGMVERGFNVVSNSSTITKRQKHHKRVVTFRLVLLIVTILSTVTTTGMILLITAFFLRFMLTKSGDNILRIIKPLLVGAVGIVGLYLAIQIFLQKSTSGSWKARFDDLRAGFLAFLSSPLSGTGFATYTGIDMFRSSWRTAGGEKAGFSNSLMQILGQGGVLLGLIYLIPIIGVLWKSIRKKRYDIFAFTVLITIVFTFTVASYKLVMLMLIAFFNAYILSDHRQEWEAYPLKAKRD